MLLRIFSEYKDNPTFLKMKIRLLIRYQLPTMSLSKSNFFHTMPTIITFYSFDLRITNQADVINSGVVIHGRSLSAYVFADSSSIAKK